MGLAMLARRTGRALVLALALPLAATATPAAAQSPQDFFLDGVLLPNGHNIAVGSRSIDSAPFHPLAARIDPLGNLVEFRTYPATVAAEFSVAAPFGSGLLVIRTTGSGSELMQLDASLNVVPACDPQMINGWVTDLLVQDGFIFPIGYVVDPGEGDLASAIWRLDINCVLDDLFGDNGVLVLDALDDADDAFEAGRGGPGPTLVLAGWQGEGANADGKIDVLDLDGNPVGTFSGDGRHLLENMGAILLFGVEVVSDGDTTLDADDRIVVAGEEAGLALVAILTGAGAVPTNACPEPGPIQDGRYPHDIDPMASEFVNEILLTPYGIYAAATVLRGGIPP